MIQWQMAKLKTQSKFQEPKVQIQNGVTFKI
jgi:hypothetical protein